MSEEDERSVTSSEESEEATPSEAGSEPTPEEQNESIDTVTHWVDNFHIQSDMAPASNVGGPTSSSSGTKVNPPMEFNGRRDQIKSFRLQCKLYWQMNPEKFEGKARNKLLFAMSYLRGKALEWIQPYMENYIDNERPEELNEATRRVLGGVDRFFKAMEETFDCGNDALEADRDLRALRQKTSAAQYRAEFQILASKVGWNDEALASQFYRGLKDRVREEITMRHERPDTLQGMADLAIKIDTRIFELQLERKGRYSPGNANTKAKRDVPEWRDNYYGLQKMQLDATQGKPGSKGQKKGQKKSKDKSQVECYGCGKKGHYKNECKARKQSHELQRSGKQEAFRATKGKGAEEESPKPATIAATHNWTYEDVVDGRSAYETTGTNAPKDQDDHGLTSWTACCDDSCAIHMNDKMGSGYFPSHRRQSICLTRGMPVPTQAAQEALTHYPALIREDFSPNEQALEESEEEAEEDESSEESDSDEDQFTTSFRAGDIVPIVLGRIMLRKDEVFPWIDGQQRVHDSAFTQMIWDVRQILRNTPLVEQSIDYHMVVQEWPPIGSDFTMRGGYGTPDGICIPRTMRQQVRELKREYAMEAERQTHEQAARVQPLSPRSPRTEQDEETHQARFGTPTRMGDDARDTTPCENMWEPPLSVSDPRDVPHSRHNRLGLRSEGQNTSGGQNRANQRSGN